MREAAGNEIGGRVEWGFGGFFVSMTARPVRQFRLCNQITFLVCDSGEEIQSHTAWKRRSLHGKKGDYVNNIVTLEIGFRPAL